MILALALIAGTLSAQRFEMALLPAWESLAPPRYAFDPPPPQAPPLPAVVTAAFSFQPIEAFRAVTGSFLKGVSLVQVTVCNAAPSAARVPSGRIYMAANRGGMATVAPSVALPTLMRANQKNKLRIAAELLQWASLTGGIITTGGTVAVAEGIRYIFPTVAMATTQARSIFKDRVPDVSLLIPSLLDGDLDIAAGGCANKLLVARWDSHLKPFEAEVH